MPLKLETSKNELDWIAQTVVPEIRLYGKYQRLLAVQSYTNTPQSIVLVSTEFAAYALLERTCDAILKRHAQIVSQRLFGKCVLALSESKVSALHYNLSGYLSTVKDDRFPPSVIYQMENLQDRLLDLLAKNIDSTKTYLMQEESARQAQLIRRQ